MFILNKVQYLLWVSFPSKIKRTNLYRRGQPINNTGCLLLSECFFQHCFSIADPALRNIILCDCYLVKLFYYLILASVSTFCTADISKLSFSISSSLKCLYTSAETSGPMEIKRIAAFCLPVSCLVLAIVLSS